MNQIKKERTIETKKKWKNYRKKEKIEKWKKGKKKKKDWEWEIKKKKVWFGLVSLFNGISTFMGYLIPKLPL